MQGDEEEVSVEEDNNVVVEIESSPRVLYHHKAASATRKRDLKYAQKATPPKRHQPPEYITIDSSSNKCTPSALSSITKR